MVNINTRTLPGNTGYWLGLPLLVTLIGFMPGELITHSTLLIFYLCAVLTTALRADQASVIASALSGFLLFSYFHSLPRYSFLMHADDEVLSAVVFVIFAVLAGQIAERQRRQLQLLKEQSRFFSTQITFYQQLQGISKAEEITALLNQLFSPLFNNEVQFSLDNEPDGKPCTLQWQHHGALPLVTQREAMLLSLKEQVQSALQKIETNRALKLAERQSDEDKLRSALLSSVSHDLKTPLVTMLGAATSLRDLRQDLSQQDADELLASIITESQRLESYIQNLLDMTRLDHGELALTRDWVSLEEIYHVVSRRIERLVTPPHMQLHVSQELPSLFVHAALIEQALFNVIENALKAAGAESEIRVDARLEDDKMIISVSDQGPGLPESEWLAVFNPFHTFSLGDCYEKGTGLGLSICQSIFRVHGGNAEICPAPAGFNHCVLLSLPLPDSSTNMLGDNDD